jgi:hypothetical protein
MNYFKTVEIECRDGCGLSSFDPKMLGILNQAREKLGRAIIINCGCRCVAYNKVVGGAKHSAHLPGPDGFCHAVDVQVFSDITRAHLRDILADLGIKRFEVSDLHLHADNAIWLPNPILASVNFRGHIET